MSKVPVTTLAGFLGAGKTTLLNRILGAGGIPRLAVLVNDFGAINIDASLVTAVSGETLSLANGCICCTIREDLAQAVEQVLGADPPPEHIVIEASGVSDPAAVALALAMRPSLATRTAIDAIVTVVDAEEFPRLEGDAAALAVDQVAAADLIVINKTDRVDPAGLDAVRARVRAIAADARVVSAVHADVPLDIVLGTRAGPASTPPSHAHAHAHHDERFVSFSWSSDEALAFQALYEALRTLPASIYRGKGIVNLAEVPDRRVIVQMVGRRVTVERGAPWGREAPSTRVALIGAPDGIEVAALEQRFDACRRRVSTAPPSRMAAAVIEILRRPG